MSKQRKRKDSVGTLQDELKRRDERIAELRDEVDENRDLIRRQREQIEEEDSYIENFITTLGITMDADGYYINGELIEEHNKLIDQSNQLSAHLKKMIVVIESLVRENNGLRDLKRPVGRPIAASEWQQVQALAYHKNGKSMRWIAEAMTLSRRTVSTIIDKADDVDRTTTKRRVKLDLPIIERPKRRKWSLHLSKQANKLRENARELDKEAKGLGSSRSSRQTGAGGS